MTKYYFLATALPALEIGKAPDIGFNELELLLKENLTEYDYQKVRLLRGLYDINNLRAFWNKEPFDKWGNLNQNTLEEVLLTKEALLPPYIFDFLNEYETREKKIEHFPSLTTLYFDKMQQESLGFLKKYATFERNLRLTLTAFRARQLKRDLAKELYYHDPQEEIVAQLLAQKDSKTFEPPVGFEELKPLIEQYYQKPIELEKALVEYRLEKLDEMASPDVFSIDHILLYVIRYIFVDKWIQLDKEKGIEIIDLIVKDIT